MAELENIFTWSVSARDDFAECPRRRYWAKYAMWNGWAASATPLQRTAYRLSKMENRFSIQGNAVERAVMWLLSEARAGREHSAEEAYTEIARPYLNRCWQESKQRLWQANPKLHCCLHEHYYPEHHRTPESEMTARMIVAVKACLQNFIQLVLPRLRRITPADELPIATVGAGDPESFTLDGVKIYAIPDYVCRSGAMLEIYDWKSGAPRENHKDQMAVYGVWANLKHQYPAEKIAVRLEYLLPGKSLQVVLTEEDLARTRDMIRASVSEMAEYLEDGDIQRNVPLPREDWEMSADIKICQRCNFFELCRAELAADNSPAPTATSAAGKA